MQKSHCALGATMWTVNDATDGKLLAYDLRSSPIGERLPGYDIALDSYINRNPRGIAVDGETMWVANWEGYNSSRLFAYQMPEPRVVAPSEPVTPTGDATLTPGLIEELRRELEALRRRIDEIEAILERASNQ